MRDLEPPKFEGRPDKEREGAEEDEEEEEDVAGEAGGREPRPRRGGEREDMVSGKGAPRSGGTSAR